MKLIKLIIILSIFLTSCDFTQKLWRGNYYNETIMNFLISNDGQKIVVLGEKYHYVFDDKDAKIKEILLWEGRDILEISEFNFETTGLDGIRGRIRISTLKDHRPISDDDAKFLKAQFRDVKCRGSHSCYQKDFYLTGTRYLPRPNVNYNTISSLNREYKLVINNNDLLDRSKKIALTPIAVSGDAAVIVVGAVAIALFVPALVICSAISKNCLKHH